MMRKIVGIFICMLLLLLTIPIGGSSDDNEPAPELSLKVYGGFGITVIIKNVGDADATNISAFIGVFGGTPFGRNTIGKHPKNISPGKSAIVRFRYVGFGLGLLRDIPEVHVHIGCDEEKYNNTEMNALILFNLILLG